MELSIIITTYNSRGLLRQLLQGLLKFPPKVSHEIIVVDNDSRDKTDEMMHEQFPSICYIHSQKNLGLAKGNNLGIRQSTGEYVLILNPDIAVFEDEIDYLLEFLKTHNQAGVVAPQLLHPDKSIQFSTFIFPKWYIPILRRTPLGKISWSKKQLKQYMMKDWDHNESKKVDWVLGAAMLIRKSALAQVGLQDEDYFLYFEDVDWCKRFWKNGFEVWYTPKSKLVHYHKRESAENPGLKGIFNPLTNIHIRSWIAYLKKHPTKKQ